MRICLMIVFLICCNSSYSIARNFQLDGQASMEMVEKNVAVSLEETEQSSRPLHFQRENTPSAVKITGSYIMGMLVLVILIITSWFLRNKLNHKNPRIQKDKSLLLIMRQRLSTKTVLYVVHYQNQELLIAEHSHGVSLLASQIKSDVDITKAADNEI